MESIIIFPVTFLFLYLSPYPAVFPFQDNNCYTIATAIIVSSCEAPNGSTVETRKQSIPCMYNTSHKIEDLVRPAVMLLNILFPSSSLKICGNKQLIRWPIWSITFFRLSPVYRNGWFSAIVNFFDSFRFIICALKRILVQIQRDMMAGTQRVHK